MANLTRTNWPAGWVPSLDALNGSPEGLLRADNLKFDKEGAVTLIDGFQTVSASALSFVSAFYSKIFGSTEYLYSAFGLPPTAITRAAGFIGSTSLLVSGSGTPDAQAGFADAFGYVFAVAGTHRSKDRITDTPKPLGLLTPQRPTVVVNNRDQLTIACPTTVFEGSGTSPELTLDSTTLEGQLCTASSSALDTTSIGGAPATDIGLDIFEFPFTVTDQPGNVITRIELDVLLDGNPADPSSYGNYYAFTWKSDLGEIPEAGLNTRTILTRQRVQAERFGTDTLDWRNVTGVRFLVNASVGCTVKFGDIKVTGGSEAGLNGIYNFIQVDVRNDGVYLAKSPASAEALFDVPTDDPNFILVNGNVTLTPTVTDPNVTEHWFFRRAAPNQVGINPNSGQPLVGSVLGQYYFVGSSTLGATFRDSLSDQDILQLNADGSLLPNLFLQTLRADDSVNGLQDRLTGIEGIYNERILYLSNKFLYLSDRLNPDAVDTRFILKPSGDQTETNLWIKKVSNDLCILATTKNLYQLSGTLLDAPDGSVDARLVPIGEAFPPLSSDVCNHNGGLYYVAADGLRVTTGSNSVNLSPQLRNLFQEVKMATQAATLAAHGVPGVAIYNGQGVSYSVAAAKHKIYFVVPLQDGTRRVFVFDLVSKTYECRFTDPLKLFATQAGELLAAYGSPSFRIFALDTVPGYGVDGQAEIPFKLRTVFDPNEQPRNRKDTFTLKLVFDSGGEDISVDIQKDGLGVTDTDETTWTNLGHYSANGPTTKYISLEDVTPGFRYSIQLSDVSGVKKFILYEYTIEYEPRPEQVNYLRLLPTNLGTISRKRHTAFAFVIDTLGNNVTFTPYLDNVAWSSSDTFSTGTKLTYIFYFRSEAIATDIGGILVAANDAPFEFYGVDLNESVSEKLPVPTKYLVIPANDYGTPNRKRHTSYKFQMNTRNAAVRFTPKLDGVTYTPTDFTTTEKRTCEHFFSQGEGDVIGIDIGGILESQANTPFEFYGVIVPQKIEVLPDRLEYFRIPNSNFGVNARKRIRTLPLVIDTRGTDVTFTPIIDGVQGTPTVLNTDGKTTTYHYFATDVFGTDFGGILHAPTGEPFEFYEMGRPESVEVLPVPKLFDQLGPARFDKIGKIFGFRIRLISTDPSGLLAWKIYNDDSVTLTENLDPIIQDNLPVIPNVDNVYEVKLPKSINFTVGRLVFGPAATPFHRYDVQLKVHISGMPGEARWIPIR